MLDDVLDDLPEDFWERSEYADRAYVGPPLTDAMVREVEGELGYVLPRSYVALMKTQNGGIPTRRCHRTTEPTTWADDHVALTGMYSIGREKDYSLCGRLGSRFWVAEWGYPEIGVYFADCPTAGHHMLCLDYRDCGPQGEPRVVHVDQEGDYAITVVAETFESFVRGLEDEEQFAQLIGGEGVEERVRRAELLEKLVRTLHLSVPERRELGEVSVREVEDKIVAVLAWEGVYPRAPWKEGDEMCGDGVVLEELPDGRVRAQLQVSGVGGEPRYAESRDFEDVREAVR